ncbi:hypothetical protein TcYC6_0047620 [Trypanosoma cruzi]|nr:hypothetical protein TcYC6_0047620 [Trypanosoma cruzi]
MRGPVDTLEKLDALMDAMRTVVSRMESEGAADTREIMRRAAALQCTLHSLSREATAIELREEQMRRDGLR